MSDNSFDAFARSAAAAIDRRKSLRTLGGAALVAALANPLAVESAKDNKAKKAKKKAKKKCRRQVGQCQGGVEDLCQLFFPGNPIQQQQCFAAFDQCCDPLRTCNTSGLFSCIQQVFLTL